MIAELSPYDLVRMKYSFPFEGRPLQIEAINNLAPRPRSGWWAEVGTGKTFMTTVVALYKQLLEEGLQWIVIVPPILIKQWYRWLTECVAPVGGRRPTAVMYRGSPKERRQLRLDTDFIIMSMQIFKNDCDYLRHVFKHRKFGGLVDEATSVKNPGTDNYRSVRDFFPWPCYLLLLTGTPLSKPGDAYAYVKLITPEVYRNQRHFEQLHVGERDFFGNVTKWENLDFLSDNLMLNSTRLLKRDVLPYLQEPIYDPIEFELDSDHTKLYRKLAEEQLLILEDGGKIDATSAARLYNCLQQIICNPGHFSGDPTMRSAAHELVDQVLEQINAADHENGRKLIIAANYRMTNRGLLQYLQPYGAVACFSEVPVRRQIENVERFKSDPSCRVIMMQPMSGGYGTDGLQEVCSDVLFIETPIVPKDFHQVVGRVDRDGQTVTPTIRIAIASGTIQRRLYSNLLANDALVNRVQGGWKDLREAIYGE